MKKVNIFLHQPKIFYNRSQASRRIYESVHCTIYQPCHANPTEFPVKGGLAPSSICKTLFKRRLFIHYPAETGDWRLGGWTPCSLYPFIRTIRYSIKILNFVDRGFSMPDNPGPSFHRSVFTSHSGAAISTGEIADGFPFCIKPHAIAK